MRHLSALLGLALTLTTTAPSAPAPLAPPAQLRVKTLPVAGENFLVAGRAAFLIASSHAPAGQRKPWVWYAPTLPPYPGPEEKWLIEQLLAAGIAVAGIDVGESYGSPVGTQLFTALHTELTTARGYSPRPVLLGRSRGGLQLLSWAATHPDRVAAFAGIYPVCNLTNYPGVGKAAPAFGLTPAELGATLHTHNPIDRLAPLAAARVPLFAIHGDVDKLVPLDANSGLVRERYLALGGTMELIIPPGQGHSMWPGFFQSPELIAFLRRHATR